MKKLIKVFVIFVLLLVGIIFLGYYETKSLRVKEYNIVDKDLPDSFNGVKVIHFGDVLYGSSVDYKYLNKVVKEMNKYKPDIVIFTGDLSSKDSKLTKKNKEEIISCLKKIKPSLYKYAIYGDNDDKEYEEIMQDAGFIVLKDNYEELYYESNTPIIIGNTDTDAELFTIRLVHKPDDIDKIAKDNVDVILSGHSLNGQIRVPFYGALIRRSGAKKYTDDYYKFDNYKVYITNGLGTNSPNLRILNTPSFNLYRLTNY
ncbi:MAG: hypothetical protein IKP79_01630 [Bacilli bacterium]|nr:hypothetical protein [Bacilli bacterium]